MTRELYVYFRSPVNHADAVQAAATEMQASLRRDVRGLQARLLRRIEAQADRVTWMETYAVAAPGGAQGIDDALCTTIAQRAAAWQHLIDGERHIEVFDACA